MQLLADYQAGSSTLALAKRYKTSPTSVKTLAALAWHTTSPRPPPERERRAGSAELYQACWSLVEIGRKLGVDGATLRRWLRQIGMQTRGPHERSGS